MFSVHVNKIIKLFETLIVYYRLYNLNVNKINLLNIRISKEFNLKILNKEDLHLFNQFNLPEKYLKIYLARFESNNFICFAIIDTKENNLAYYSWINFEKKTYCKEIKKTLDLENKNACLFEDDNTHEDYRKLKLHSFVMNERLKYCIDKEIKKVYIIIHPKNIPAIKTIKKFNFIRSIHFPYTYRNNSFSLIFNKLNTIGTFKK